jgi:hypothetical protein
MPAMTLAILRRRLVGAGGCLTPAGFLTSNFFALHRHYTRRHSPLRVSPRATTLLGLLATPALDGVDLGDDSGNFFCAT